MVGRLGRKQWDNSVERDCLRGPSGSESIIEVDGDTATGKWRLIMPATVMTSGVKEARWLLGAYDDRYVSVDGVWKFKRLSFHINFYSPHVGSWAESAVD
jgi:hypothetical protein